MELARIEWGSPRDGILRVLGEQKVRVLTREQIARTWFGHVQGPARSAAVCVRNLDSHDFVRVSSAMLHPEIDVSRPLFSFRPGDEEPDTGRLSWWARRRFTKSPVRTVIVTPGPGLVLGSLRHLRSTEILHDTLVASLFLSLVDKDARVFERWSLEDLLAGRFTGKIPDAVLITDHGEVVIEVIGAYSARKVAEIHAAFCHGAYQLY